MKRFDLLSLLALTLVCACNGNRFGEDGNPEESDVPVEHGMIVLGDKLEDPYTVENMSAALASLYPTKADRVVLDPTDLYVRFLPSSDAQMERLMSMNLQLVDHPVDFQIVKEGDWYHDPEIEEGSITWQYAVVPADFVFPEGIDYEVLDECFIADSGTAAKSGDIDWEAVERESFRLTGNLGMLSDPVKSDPVPPCGRITVSDPESSSEPIGVKGVMVSCNTFVKFSRAYTDEEGYYQMSKTFSGKPRYRLVFKNQKGFCIGFNLLLVPASVSTLGKGTEAGLSLHVDGSSDRKLFARSVVNNACWDYCESCVSGERSISMPPADLRIWLFGSLDCSSAPMLHHGAFVEEGVIKDFLGEYVSLLELFLPDVTLGIKNSASSYSSLYLSTIHELAHASHFMKAGRGFWNRYISYVLNSFVSSGFEVYGSGSEADHGYCEVGEMWAYYIQSSICRSNYPSRDCNFGTGYWFSPQILLYLEDRGLNKFKIFEALRDDVTDRDLLQERLLMLWPESKNAINQAFGRYN